MEFLINQIVEHKLFGKGKIVDINGLRLTIKFNDKTRIITKKYFEPNIIKRTLCYSEEDITTYNNNYYEYDYHLDYGYLEDEEFGYSDGFYDTLKMGDHNE